MHTYDITTNAEFPEPKQIWKQGGSSRSPGYIQLTLGLCQLTPSDCVIFFQDFKEADNTDVDCNELVCLPLNETRRHVRRRNACVAKLTKVNVNVNMAHVQRMNRSVLPAAHTKLKLQSLYSAIINNINIYNNINSSSKAIINECGMSKSTHWAYAAM